VAGYLRGGADIQEQHGRSQRKAAALVGSAASVLCYNSKRADDAPVVERLRELATERPRFGYRTPAVWLSAPARSAPTRGVGAQHQEDTSALPTSQAALAPEETPAHHQ
jgi:hypothetical protein